MEFLGHTNAIKYIILEIIPTKVSGGDVAQLSALKINGIKLEDRFDYRLDKNKINDRVDLRDKEIFTIDGEDAKDLDDAVRVEKLQDGNYLLEVHIADVSEYVKPDSLLDKEAYLRGTSIYMLGRVIPMLPRELSNGICSLNMNEDRFTLSCSMVINNKGEVVDSKVYKGLIRVTERMNYNDVQKILDKSDEKVLKRYEKYIPEFELMAELANIIKEFESLRLHYQWMKIYQKVKSS